MSLALCMEVACLAWRPGFKAGVMSMLSPFAIECNKYHFQKNVFTSSPVFSPVLNLSLKSFWISRLVKLPHTVVVVLQVIRMRFSSSFCIQALTEVGGQSDNCDLSLCKYQIHFVNVALLTHGLMQQCIR